LSASEATAVLTRDEIADAIRGLTAAQWARLKLVAKKYAGRCRLEPDDLLQEAFRRALEESGRKCPDHIDVVKFLAEAMRSIADGEANKAENRVTLVSIVNHTHQQDGEVDPEDVKPNAEAAMESDQAAATIRRDVLALFDGDPTAHDLVEGIIAGFSADELRQLVNLDPTAYASKRRLIRRTIDKHYPKGWQL
jgi:RNA polymerase sigma-70 factor (ECF subfamily)